MIQSLSTFLVLFKNSLWLHGEKPALKKMDALRQLKGIFDFNLVCFEAIDGVKRGAKTKGFDSDKIFGAYLGALESLTERLNRPKPRKGRKTAVKKK
jgi:hypothetical protein